MTGLDPALHAVMEQRHVGDVLADGSRVLAQVDTRTGDLWKTGIGGYVMTLLHNPTASRKKRWVIECGKKHGYVLTSSDRFPDLYQSIRNAVKAFPSVLPNGTQVNWSVPWDSVEQMLREFVISRYDMNDPVETAEATLVGLGGDITLFPRSVSV